MAKPGPPLTPTRTLKLRGSWRGKINKHEPQVDPERPVCPAWIDRTAKLWWREVVPQLHKMGVLAKIDRKALERTAVIYSRWRRMMAFITEHGETYNVKDSKGKVKYLKRFPQVAIAAELDKELGRCYAEFGMTPSARSRVTATATPAQQTPAALMFGHDSA